MNAWSFNSIQDFLLSLGFSIDQDQGQFLKWETGWQHVTIPFSELAGHTVFTFMEKARNRGWIPAEGSGSLSEGDSFQCV